MERHIVIPPIVVADGIPGPRSAGTSCQLPRVYRCRAGFDNGGACHVRGHNGWHTSAQANCLRYDYDRCRRERGHELNPTLPYYKVHLPDCGGAVWSSGTWVMDFTATWEDIYDLVERSGEHLWWFGDDVEGHGQTVTRSDWTE